MIAQMTAGEIVEHVEDMLPKIQAATGWKMPAIEMQIDALIEAISLRLVEAYKFLNFKEIEFAIRSAAGQVREYGKEISVALLNECLEIYMQERNEANKAEARVDDEIAKLPEPPRDMTATEWNEWVDELRAGYLRGVYRLTWFPCVVYDYLDRTGAIRVPTTVKKEFYNRAINLLKVQNGGTFENGEAVALAKQLALANFFDESGKMDTGTIPAIPQQERSEQSPGRPE